MGGRKTRRKVAYSPKKAAFVYGMKGCPFCGHAKLHFDVRKSGDSKLAKAWCEECGVEVAFSMSEFWGKADGYAFLTDLAIYWIENHKLPEKTRFPISEFIPPRE